MPSPSPRYEARGLRVRERQIRRHEEYPVRARPKKRRVQTRHRAATAKYVLDALNARIGVFVAVAHAQVNLIEVFGIKARRILQEGYVLLREPQLVPSHPAALPAGKNHDDLQPGTGIRRRILPLRLLKHRADFTHEAIVFLSLGAVKK
jgi:hypothetical protein